MNQATFSDQNIPTPIRNQFQSVMDRLGEKIDARSDEMEQNDPVGGFIRMMNTICQVSRAWVGDHDADVKELMTMLADADIRVALKKEIEALQEKGLPILP